MGYKEEQAILNQQTEVPCPGGGRDQRCKMGDIIGRSSMVLKTGQTGALITGGFASSDFKKGDVIYDPNVESLNASS